VYPRVSTPEQRRNVSAEMQQDKSFAIKCGWKEDTIIVDDRDLGVSGQLRMEDREAFRDMLRRIQGRDTFVRIGAVVVRDVARLFRNKWGDEPGKFMEICFAHTILVVTADFVYDFRISWHIDKFKRKCEEAYSHIENHIFGVMLPAMDEQANAGFWVGGGLPMGYAVERREKINGEDNPHYNRFYIYEPHAQVIRWLFRRFKQLHGNARELLREIERMPVLFPDFDSSVPDDVVSKFKHYKKVPGGYTIASDAGLRHVLTNRVYIGDWMYQGVIVKTDNHPAIVDLADFLFAYNRLSPTKLDGTPNEQALHNQRKYARKQGKRQDGLLKECIQAKDPTLRIYPKYSTPKQPKWYYGVFRRGASSTQTTPLATLPCGEIDRIVLLRLIERMQEPQAEEDLGNFLAFEEAATQEASETLKDIERDIAAQKALIERLKKQAQTGQLIEEDLAKEANESYKTAKAELARLEARKQDTTSIAQEDEERRTYKQVMREVGEAWEEIIMPDEFPRLMYLYIKQVTLDFLSPRFFTLTITWRDQKWEQDEFTCYRYSNPSCTWTEAEEATLRELYPGATRYDLLHAFPRRTYLAICEHAGTLGIKRVYHAEEVDVPYRTCWLDWQLMQEYGLEEEELRREKCVKIAARASPLHG
jgi:DNA invertase Pin-like site-specific DNA recombinase